ncbi:MAG: class I SAM-dependent methyltransferase [Spirochaetaceae bacterium]
MSDNSSTLRYYDDNAEEIARGYEEVDMGKVVDRVASHLPVGGRILEIGPGSGRDAAHLLSRGFDVYAVDGSGPLLAAAARLHPELNGRLSHCILPEPLPFDDATFDGVISLATLMHLRHRDLPRALAETRRVMRQGGVAVLSVSTQRSGLNDQGTDAEGRHFTILTGEDWVALMRDARFSVRSRRDNADTAGRAGIAWTTLVGIAE